MEITCRARTTLWHPGFRKIYSCNIIKSDLRVKDDHPINFVLTHDDKDKTDDDVEAVVILDSKIHNIPKNFEQIFKNLSILCIKQCNLEKVERKDLQNFSCLREVWMPNNKLKQLPDNLFIDHPKVEKLSFSNNQLSVIGGKLLDPLENLKYANFNKNLTIDVTFDVDDDKIDLEELKRIIQNNCKGFNRSIFKPRKRNFSYMRNSLEAHQQISSNTESMSSIQNISSQNSSSYQMVQVIRRRQFISSGSSINSQQSFQKIKYVTKRVNHHPETPKSRKPRSTHQETQTEKKTFTEDLNDFLMRENFKDFSIKNERKTFNVHRFVMAARSPVVCNMIQKNPLMRGIELLNANDDIIEHLLDFIYDDQLPKVDEFGDFLKIYDLSVKLELKELVEYAKKNVLKKINSENAIECLEMASKHNDKDMKIKGLEIVEKMFPQRKFKASLAEDSEALKKMIEELKIMKKAIDEATLKFNQLSFFESKTEIKKY